MKKLFSIISILCICLLCFSACNVPINEETGKEETVPVTSLFIITEVRAQTLVGVIDGQTDRMSIPNWFADYDIQPNEFIKVTHNGIFLETWPLQISEIYSMEYFTTTGETILIEKPEVVINTIFVEKYDGEIPIKKKVLNSDTELIIEYTTNMADGTEYICNCPPNFTIQINNHDYYYHSQTGVIIDSESKSAFLINNKDAMNEILNKYLGGVQNG